MNRGEPKKKKMLRAILFSALTSLVMWFYITHKIVEDQYRVTLQNSEGTFELLVNGTDSLNYLNTLSEKDSLFLGAKTLKPHPKKRFKAKVTNIQVEPSKPNEISEKLAATLLVLFLTVILLVLFVGRYERV